MNSSRTRLRSPSVALACVLVLGVQGCGIRTERASLLAPAQAPVQTKQSPYLKAHLKSGEVYVLDSWRVAPDSSRLEGTGPASRCGGSRRERGRSRFPSTRSRCSRRTLRSG